MITIGIGVSGAAAAQQQMAGLSGQTAKWNQQLQFMKQASGQGKQVLGELGNSAKNLSNALGGLAASFSGLAVIRSAVRLGMEVNSMLEQTQYGIAALINLNHKFSDSMGRVVGPVRSFDAALGMALKTQNQLRAANLETAATLPELMIAYQEAIAVVGRLPGATDKALVQVTTRISQLAAAMNIPQYQLGEEIRSLLTGFMRPRITRIAPAIASAMGGISIGEANKQLRVWYEQGVIVEKVNALLVSFDAMGKKAMGTWAFTMSNLKDATQAVLGEGFRPLFDYVKSEAQKLQAVLIDIDPVKGLTPKASVVEAIRGMAESLKLIADQLKTIAGIIVKIPFLSSERALKIAVYAAEFWLMSKGVSALAGSFRNMKEASAGLNLGGLFGSSQAALKKPDLYIYSSKAFDLVKSQFTEMKRSAIDLSSLFGSGSALQMAIAPGGWMVFGLTAIAMLTLELLRNWKEISGFWKDFGGGPEGPSWWGTVRKFWEGKTQKAVPSPIGQPGLTWQKQVPTFASGIFSQEDLNALVAAEIKDKRGKTAELDRLLETMGFTQEQRLAAYMQTSAEKLKMKGEEADPEKLTQERIKYLNVVGKTIEALQLEKQLIIDTETEKEMRVAKIKTIDAEIAKAKEAQADKERKNLQSLREEEQRLAKDRMRQHDEEEKDLSDAWDEKKERIDKQKQLDRERIALYLSSFGGRSPAFQREVLLEQLDVEREALGGMTAGLDPSQISDTLQEKIQDQQRFVQGIEEQIRGLGEEIEASLVGSAEEVDEVWERVANSIEQNLTDAIRGVRREGNSMVNFLRDLMAELSQKSVQKFSQDLMELIRAGVELGAGVLQKIGILGPGIGQPGGPQGPAQAGAGFLAKLRSMGTAQNIGSAAALIGSFIPGRAGGIISGAGQGAAIGSMILPGWGTAIGAVIGGIGGAFSGGKKKKDPVRAQIKDWVAGELWPALEDMKRLGFGAGIFGTEHPSGTNFFKGLGFAAGIPQKALEEMKNMAESMQDAIGNALEIGFESFSISGGWTDFLKNIRQGLADYVKQGFMDGILKGGLLSKTIAPFVESVANITKQFTEGTISAGALESGISGAFSGALPGIQALQPIFEMLAGTWSRLQPQITGKSSSQGGAPFVLVPVNITANVSSGQDARMLGENVAFGFEMKMKQAGYQIG